MIDMDIQEIHQRYDDYRFNSVSGEIELIDCDGNVLKFLDTGYLIELWFNEQDR